jgi:hypothetical protein
MKKKTPRSRLPYGKRGGQREPYRLWFEFLRLARASAEPEVRRALSASARFYAPWEDVMNVHFDDWWRGHSHLFEEKLSVRRLARREAPSDPDALVLELPLALSTVALVRQVRAVIREARDARPRPARRTRRRPMATYRLTEGAEPNLRAMRIMLAMYRDVRLRDPKLRGKKLLDAAHAYYARRKSEEGKKVPGSLRPDRYGDTITAMRNLGRYIQRAKKITLNVARGEFPGRYDGGGAR